MLLLLRASFERQPIYLAKSNIFHQPTCLCHFQRDFPSQFRKPYFWGAQKKLVVFSVAIYNLTRCINLFHLLPCQKSSDRSPADGFASLDGFSFTSVGWGRIYPGTPRKGGTGTRGRPHTSFPYTIYWISLGILIREACMGILRAPMSFGVPEHQCFQVIFTTWSLPMSPKGSHRILKARFGFFSYKWARLNTYSLLAFHKSRYTHRYTYRYT